MEVEIDHAEQACYEIADAIRPHLAMEVLAYKRMASWFEAMTHDEAILRHSVSVVGKDALATIQSMLGGVKQELSRSKQRISRLSQAYIHYDPDHGVMWSDPWDEVLSPYRDTRWIYLSKERKKCRLSVQEALEYDVLALRYDEQEE